MTRRNAFATRLADAAKTIAKARPSKLHSPLYDAFVVFAASGDVPRASSMLDWMYGARVPPPTEVANVLSTAVMDGFCHATRLGDHTHGLPLEDEGSRTSGSLVSRVRTANLVVRERLTGDAYGTRAPKTDAWQKLRASDVSRAILRWRRIQSLAESGDEKAALERLVPLLDEWSPDDRGVGYGDELVLAIDLAIRHRQDRRIPAWLTRHGHRFASESFLIDSALCLPAVAKKIASGMLRDVVGLSDGDRASALDAIDRAIDVAANAKPKPPGKVQRRRVTAEYSQVYVQPEHLDDTERAQVHFQKRGDSARGVSLFPTNVGIGTPTDTDYVDAEITISSEAPRDRADVVQAVAFPLRVRGPLVLESATGDDGDPFIVPIGSYDVLARFIAKRKASRGSPLRVFTLLLSFHPPGSLRAPRTIKR